MKEQHSAHLTDEVRAARAYFSALKTDVKAYFEAAQTEEFHRHFLTILNSIPPEQRERLYEKSKRANERFQQRLAEGISFWQALEEDARDRAVSASEDDLFLFDPSSPAGGAA